mmetsp:Transcript_7405/g.16840  ORF Transcript_7405/g.16840 Transcript_7405/m.16840 type:complete len:153 (-) Transcript_7405:966-1424(-)
MKIQTSHCQGMWTRFFPAVEQARHLVFEEQILGEIISVNSDFNFDANDCDDEYPSSPIYNHSLGGGASYQVGPYPLAAATLFFPSNPRPERIRAAGQVDPLTGVDLQAAAVVSFPPTGSVSPVLDKTNGQGKHSPKLPGYVRVILSSLVFWK